MSGIYGLITAAGETRTTRAAGMLRALGFRGPHGHDAWAGDGAMLGRLGAADVPWAAADGATLEPDPGGLLIVADLRLDGRQALCRRLGLAAEQATSSPDEALLLAAYRAWGDDCIQYLEGDFAFALWDMRRRRLFCARDAMGMRPFYYAQAGSEFLFASSARAVAEALPGGCVLNHARVADFLAGLEAIDETGTFYRNVLRLPRAHCAVFDAGRLQLRRYWKPQAGAVARFRSDDECLQAFTEVYETAVAERMASTAPIAVTLSGGLDSSTIVALARDWLRARGQGPLATYSGVSDTPGQCVESRFIAAVAGAGGVDATRISPHEVDVSRLPPADEPWDDMMTILACCYAAAGARGQRVVLDGLDGELLCALPESYPAFLAREGQWAAAWREYRGQQRHYFRARPRLSGFLAMWARAVAPASARAAVRGFRGAGTRDAGTADLLLSQHLAAEVNLPERIAAERAACGVGAGMGLREACAARVMAPYNVAGIERYNRVAARHGVEARSPLLDRRLLEFCLALPWNQKSCDGWSKYLLRRVAERRLPSQVAWREGWEHIGWDFNVARLRQGGQLHVERLQDHRAALRAFIADEALQRTLNALGPDHGSIDETVRLVADLAAWLEREGFV